MRISHNRIETAPNSLKDLPYGKSSWLFITYLVGLLLFLFSCPAISNLDKSAKKGNEEKIVQRFGQLQVTGNRMVDQHGNPAVLRGMSLFWSQWMGQYYNYDCIRWLRDDWKCTVVRASLGIGKDGYLENPGVEMAKIRTVIEACLELGIYVIVDWHDHQAYTHQSEAIVFFKEIAGLYGTRPNIIYEIFNEPEKVSWNDVVKPYADSVIVNIRNIDPDNLILVGTPFWSQDVDVVSLNPLSFKNVAYTLHYYATTHRQPIRDKAVVALNNGVALFVSEFGTCEHTGSGWIDRTELETWFDFMEQYGISWCNWSIADKNETSAALKSGAAAHGAWPDAELSESGVIIRGKIRSTNGALFSAPGN
jgi:endoglucanase